MISFLVSFYQKHLSPLWHRLGKSLFSDSFACRFSPTCSQYFKEAVQKYGIIHGAWLGLKRFLRCHPFTQGGHDPLL